MIESGMHEYLLSEFDLGASTAENDPLLETAKIETQEWNDLYWHDRIDLIRGIKGSGKTALYRLFSMLQSYIIEKVIHIVYLELNRAEIRYLSYTRKSLRASTNTNLRIFGVFISFR